ncbi:hypothetical protein [Melittangium boletus]|uniref:Uncharacterized protein n=1 Tax=Melittangium boletus DSM 14713 TaxID=1294270 RepID=A0A250I8V8_9BACT|nr:hypothetical protein [Melittangium boletus]ATB27396.1 hypothetical protein MEBOL_000834 [Melittangium boletus DSM 14713]
MTNPPNGLPPLSGYTPTPESLRVAEEQLAKASPEELSAAARAWVVYSRSAGGRSSITGAELPGFYMTPTLVRAAWLAVVRDLRGRAPTPPPAESTPKGTPEVKPVTRQPAAEEGAARSPGATLPELCRGARDLAEAVSLMGSSDTEAARTVTKLVKLLSKRLRARMNQL